MSNKQHQCYLYGKGARQDLAEAKIEKWSAQYFNMGPDEDRAKVLGMIEATEKGMEERSVFQAIQD